MAFNGRNGLIFFIVSMSLLAAAFVLQVVGYILSVTNGVRVDNIKGYTTMAFCVTSGGCFLGSRFLQKSLVPLAIYLKVIALLSVFVAGVFGMFAVKRGSDNFGKTMETTPFPVGFLLFGIGCMLLFPVTILFTIECMFTSSNNRTKKDVEENTDL